MNFKVGLGYDVHRYKEGRRLILGGVEIPFELGLDGHSDADVLLHAISDAILGALALGDIGKFFPDNDMAFKDIDSKILLGEVIKKMKEEAYSIANLDATVICERPKLRPYIDLIRKTISEIIDCPLECVSVKATTEEGLGFTGAMLGISCQAIVLIYKD